MEFFISVCIPAYGQPNLLKRCLNSLLAQDMMPFEVIITDDSPDSSVADVATAYEGKLPISYHRNTSPLGSPANWNAALRRASGSHVLLLHHDDYLEAPDALTAYLSAFHADPAVEVVSSRIVTRDTQGNQSTVPRQREDLQRMYREPERIVGANLIGPPSLLMLRREALMYYDPAYIWLVDLELYLRLLEAGRRFGYIDRHLITIALHPGQVTNTLINAPIVLREHMRIARGREERFRCNHFVFDHYWRLLRNQAVRGIAGLEEKGIAALEVPPFVRRMLRWQQRVPLRWLRFGPLSRLYMECCYRSGR